MKEFLSIAKNYKVIFLDSYGVVKNHKGLIPNVQGTIDELRRQGKIIRILTNDASRSAEQQAIRFENQGLKGLHPEELREGLALLRSCSSPQLCAAALLLRS